MLIIAVDSVHFWRLNSNIRSRTVFIFVSTGVIFLYKDPGLRVTNIGTHWSTSLPADHTDIQTTS